jgi:hypothetical protein
VAQHADLMEMLSPFGGMKNIYELVVAIYNE